MLPRRVLCDIIEPRVEEIFQAARHVLAETGYTDILASGVVITLLDGMPEHAEAVLGLPVRRGAPTGVGGLIDVVRSPAYATGVGLVKYGAARLGDWDEDLSVADEVEVPADGGLVSRISGWFREVF